MKLCQVGSLSSKLLWFMFRKSRLRGATSCPRANRHGPYEACEESTVVHQIYCARTIKVRWAPHYFTMAVSESIIVNDAGWEDALGLSTELLHYLEQAKLRPEVHSESMICAVARRIKDA